MTHLDSQPPYTPHSAPKPTHLPLSPSGLHLEIDPRGGEMSIYEKKGGQSPAPPENFRF